MPTSEGKLRALTTNKPATAAGSRTPSTIAAPAISSIPKHLIGSPKLDLARRDTVREPAGPVREPLRGKRRLTRVPTLSLPPSRAELFDFRYLLGRSSARIALFEIDALIENEQFSPDHAEASEKVSERFWRSESRFVDGNDTFLSAYGHASVADCIGKSFAFFFPPTTQHRAMIQNWCNEGLVLGHFDLQSEERDGTQKAFSAAMYAVDERSNVSRFWIVLRDVTPLANALRAVTQKEQYYRELVENSGFFMIKVDGAGHPLYISPSLEKLVGFPVDEFERNFHLYRSLIHPDDHEAYEPILAARYAPHPTTVEAEYRILCRDGSYRWMFERQTQSRVVDGSDGIGRICYESLVFDIQERKLLESELRHAQRIEMVGKLAGGVAHDFNNYLTAILGQLKLSLLEVKRGSVTHERLIATEQAALRCAEMTKQLLSLAHKDQIQKQAVSVEHLINTTAALCSHFLPTSICLSVAHSAGNLTIDGDEGQLQQVLMNLIINARDAITGAGVITLSSGVREIDQRDSVITLSNGRYIELKIEDSGSGIAPEHIRHIFEPFFTTKPAGYGTGLGLSLVDSIVRSHNGGLSVKSKVAVGTAISVLLPIGNSAAVSENEQVTFENEDPNSDDGNETGQTGAEGKDKDKDKDKDHYALDPREVLIVDDEPLVRSVIKASLLGSGYVVFEAANGLEAQKLIEKYPHRFVLIIIDQSMPGMSGAELVKKIRARGNRVPLLLTTGMRTFEGAPTEPGDPHEIIVKPFDPIDLISTAFRLCQRAVSTR